MMMHIIKSILFMACFILALFILLYFNFDSKIMISDLLYHIIKFLIIYTQAAETDNSKDFHAHIKDKAKEILSNKFCW